MLYLNPKFLMLKHADEKIWAPWHIASIALHPEHRELKLKLSWPGDRSPVIAWVPALASGTLHWLGWLGKEIAASRAILTDYQRAVIEDIKANAGPQAKSWMAVGASKSRPDPAWLRGDEEAAYAWMVRRGQADEWCGYREPKVEIAKEGEAGEREQGAVR